MFLRHFEVQKHCDRYPLNLYLYRKRLPPLCFFSRISSVPILKKIVFRKHTTPLKNNTQINIKNHHSIYFSSSISIVFQRNLTQFSSAQQTHLYGHLIGWRQRSFWRWKMDFMMVQLIYGHLESQLGIQTFVYAFLRDNFSSKTFFLVIIFLLFRIFRGCLIQNKTLYEI